MKATQIVNLTPHSIKLYANSGTITMFPPRGKVIRLQSIEQQSESVTINGDSVPISSPPCFEPVIYWPMMKDCHAVLVSMPVGQIIQRNPEFGPPYEVWGPDTGPDHVVRDEDGCILGTTQFIRYYKPKVQ